MKEIKKKIDQISDQAWGQVIDQVFDQVWGQVFDQVWRQTRGQVWNQVRDQVRVKSIKSKEILLHYESEKSSPGQGSSQGSGLESGR